MAPKKILPASQFIVLCAPHFGDHYLRGSVHWQLATLHHIPPRSSLYTTTCMCITVWEPLIYVIDEFEQFTSLSMA